MNKITTIKDPKTVGSTVARTIWDLKKDCEQIEDRDIAYDLGYIMALLNVLGRKRLSDLVLNRFEHLAF
jgi:hypothetical protein